MKSNAAMSAELPPLDAHDHPEPHTMRWSALEINAICAYALAARAQVESENKRLREVLIDARVFLRDAADLIRPGPLFPDEQRSLLNTAYQQMLADIGAALGENNG